MSVRALRADGHHNPAACDRKCRRQAAQSCRAPCPQVGDWRGWQGAQHHCFRVRHSLLHQSVGKAGTPCQAPTHRLACSSCRTATRGGGGTRPLRPPASLLHKAAFCKVVASRYAEAALGVGHRWRALPGLQNGPYAKWPSPGTGARPCGRCVAVASVSCFASVPVGGLRPVITCVPLPTHRGLAAARHWPPRAGCPSAPQGGSLSSAR